MKTSFFCFFLLTVFLINAEKWDQTQAVTDIDGNTYATVTIGEQIWMAENLRTSRFNNGREITHIESRRKWADTREPAYSWYQNDKSSFQDTYGALYNWYTVEHGNLCPEGWRVPDNTDWDELSSHLGVNAGGHLKEAGTDHWNTTSEADDNKTGFTALPGGSRQADGTFEALGEWGNWWSTSESSETNALYVYLFRASTTMGKFDTYKDNGFSVRCLKN